MALDLGELVGRISLDDRGFTGTMRTAERGMNRLESTTRTSLDQVEDEFARAGDGAVREVGQAMDRLETVVEGAGRDAGRAGARAIGRGLDQAASEARDAGEEAGEEFVRGARTRIRDARGRFVSAGRDAGESAGEGLGDGVESGGRSRMGGIGGKLSGLLAKAGPWLAAGAAVGGVFMAGLAAAMEKENALAKLKAQVGAFGSESKKLGKVAGALYSDAYGQSMGDVTDAIRAVIQNIGGMRTASQKDLKAVSGSAMDLATIMEEQVGGVTRAVGTMMKNGMAKNAEEAFDILTRGVQTGANKAEDLLDTFTEYSTQFRKLGLNGKTAMGLISQGLRAGARDADTVADALKEFSIRAVDGSKASAEGFRLLGLSAGKMTAQIAKGGKPAAAGLELVLDRLRAIEDPVKREAAAVALFGTKAEDLGKALYSLDPSEAVQALGKVGGAAEKAGDTLHDTASNRLTSFGRTVKTKVVDFLGGPVLGGLESFATNAKAGFESWVADNQDTVDDVKAAWDKFTGLFGDALAGAQKWLAQNEDKIQEWSDKIGTILSTLAGIASAGLDVISGLWSIFGDTILSTVSTLVDWLLDYWSGLFKMIKGVWDIFAGIFTGDWGRVWDGIKGIVSGAIQIIWGTLKAAVKLLGAVWGLLWKGIKAVAKWAWDKITGFVQWGVEKVLGYVGWLASLPGKVGRWFGRMKDKAVDKALGLARWMRGLPRRILSALGNLGSLLWSAGRNVIQGLIDGIQSKISSVGSAMGSIASKIRGYLPFSPAKEGPLSGSGNPEASGRKIGAMLAAGITRSRGDVASAMGDLTNPASGAAVFRVRGNGPRSRGGDGASAPSTLVIDIRGGDREMKKMIRNWVRVEGGGNVQAALGQGRRR